MFRKKNKIPFIAKFKFDSQFKYLAKGANACTSISFSMCSRLLRMNRNEFFNLFPPANSHDPEICKKARLILNSCLQAGIDLNKAVSVSAVDVISKKNTDQVATGITNLENNFGGLQDVVLLKSNTIRVCPEHEHLQTLQTFHTALLSEFETELNENEIAFAAVSGGHTISFFSRTNHEGERYYYLIDSAVGGILNSIGCMEVFNSFDLLAKRLLQKWQGNDYAEVQAFTISDRVRLADKIDTNSPPSPRNN